MRIANFAVPAVVILLLLGLFYFRASKTIAYTTSEEGKIEAVDPSKFTNEHLYKGRKAAPPKPIAPPPAPAAAAPTPADSTARPAPKPAGN